MLQSFFSNGSGWWRQATKRRRLGWWRLLVTSTFGLFCLYSGYRFYRFYLWAVDRSEIYVPRPPSVEGFLPISALMGLKRFIMTGEYDLIHPAGLTIFIAALVIAFFLRKGFCGWICPVGFTSGLVERLGRRLKISFRLPFWLDIPLLSVKYLLLFFFCWIVLVKMDVTQIEVFQNAPYNLAVDAKMLFFFMDPSRLVSGVMLGLLLLSLVLPNFWCRYLCPYGGLLGLLALASPVQVKRDAKSCIDCRRCEKVCPASIRVAQKDTVRSSECIGCLECVGVCPVNNCLTLSAPGSRSIPPLLLPLAVILLFLGCWLLASLSGYWQTSVPIESFQQLYRQAATLAHP